MTGMGMGMGLGASGAAEAAEAVQGRHMGSGSGGAGGKGTDKDRAGAGTGTGTGGDGGKDCQYNGFAMLEPDLFESGSTHIIFNEAAVRCFLRAAQKRARGGKRKILTFDLRAGAGAWSHHLPGGAYAYAGTATQTLLPASVED